MFSSRPDMKMTLFLCCTNRDATKSSLSISPQNYNHDAEWRRVVGFTFRPDSPGLGAAVARAGLNAMSKMRIPAMNRIPIRLA